MQHRNFNKSPRIFNLHGMVVFPFMAILVIRSTAVFYLALLLIVFIIFLDLRKFTLEMFGRKIRVFFKTFSEPQTQIRSPTRKNIRIN